MLQFPSLGKNCMKPWQQEYATTSKFIREFCWLAFELFAKKLIAQFRIQF